MMSFFFKIEIIFQKPFGRVLPVGSGEAADVLLVGKIPEGDATGIWLVAFDI